MMAKLCARFLKWWRDGVNEIRALGDQKPATAPRITDDASLDEGLRLVAGCVTRNMRHTAGRGLLGVSKILAERAGDGDGQAMQALRRVGETAHKM